MPLNSSTKKTGTLAGRDTIPQLTQNKNKWPENIWVKHMMIWETFLKHMMSWNSWLTDGWLGIDDCLQWYEIRFPAERTQPLTQSNDSWKPSCNPMTHIPFQQHFQSNTWLHWQTISADTFFPPGLLTDDSRLTTAVHKSSRPTLAQQAHLH